MELRTERSASNDTVLGQPLRQQKQRSILRVQMRDAVIRDDLAIVGSRLALDLQFQARCRLVCHQGGTVDQLRRRILVL